MNEELKTNLEMYAEHLIQRADNLIAGSEEESREVENVNKLIRLLNDQERMEFERAKAIDEFEWKKKELKFEIDRSKQIDPDTIFKSLTMIGAGILITWFEVKGGNITPRFISNLVNRLPK